MTFYDAINACLKKYTAFAGRAVRAEFWWFMGAVYFWLHIGSWLEFYVTGRNQVSVVVMVGLLVASPALSVFWRRMHDIGLPGWIAPAIYVGAVGLAYLYWYSVPDKHYPIVFQYVFEILAWVVPLLIAALPSQHGPNKYGPNPHEVTT